MPVLGFDRRVLGSASSPREWTPPAAASDHLDPEGDMTEQQRYRVLETFGGVELREYAAHVRATVTIRGSLEKATNEAFGPLFRYISGSNRSSTSMAMTAPVIEESAGERLSMTAPVITEGTESGIRTVSFVLPGARPLADYPAPTDPRVSLHQLPVELAAALGWSGRWTAHNVARWTSTLRERLEGIGLREVGPPKWARFDPPYTPPFARRNEIVIPVARPTSGTGHAR